MRPALTLSLVTACGAPAVTSSGFAAGDSPAEVPGSSTGASSGPSGTSGGTNTSTSGTTSGSSTTSGDEGTTENTATSTSPIPDLGSGVPLGCQGKIDFLFVLSNSYTMDAEEQGKYLAALPTFITTIGQAFGKFDSHVMVVDTSATNMCDECCSCDGVPSSVYEIPLEPCDIGMGNGVTLTLGEGAANKRCTFTGGHRYIITAAEPDPVDAFLCAAQGGFSGGSPRQATAMLTALDDEKGCNAGFLRDDALLVVTVISDVEDGHSADGPEEWRARLLEAKGGEASALVFLVVTNLSEPSFSRLQTLAKSLPHADWESSSAPSWGPFFGSAVDLVADACEAYVPL